MTASIPLLFLGTGNAFAQDGRYWGSFLIDGRVLMEPSPAVLPNLRKAGADLAAIDIVFISHFHADHLFGWPFLLLEYLVGARRQGDLWVVGPPGVAERLPQLIAAGSYPQHSRERGGFDLHYVEADERLPEQQAGSTRFRSFRVEHVPDLECFGYVVEHGGRRIGYSGDTRLCDGLRKLAAAADVLVLECNQRHGGPPSHMTLDDVRTLRAEFPTLPFILTHLGTGVGAAGLPHTHAATDFETRHV